MVRVRMPLPAALLLALPVFLVGAPASAQSLWLPRDGGGAILLEALRPSIEHSDQDAASAAFFLGGHVPLGASVSLVAEVPYARFDGQHPLYYFGYWPVAHATIGNPYVGIEIQPPDSPLLVEIGARGPLTNEDDFGAALLGTVADVARWDAFAVHSVPLRAVVNVRQVNASGLLTRLRLGAIVAIPTEEGVSDLFFTVGDETEVYAIYGWQVGYEGRLVRVGSAVSGTMLLTDDTGNVGARSTNQIELHADFGSSRFRPGLEVKLPLGSRANLVPIVLGLSFGAAF